MKPEDVHPAIREMLGGHHVLRCMGFVPDEICYCLGYGEGRKEFAPHIELRLQDGRITQIGFPYSHMTPLSPVEYMRQFKEAQKGWNVGGTWTEAERIDIVNRCALRRSSAELACKLVVMGFLPRQKV